MGGRTETGLGFKVLVVEDDADIREALVEALLHQGYEVRSAGTAEAGLAELRQHTFHLVLSDYRLPGANGAWMLQEASKEGLLQTAKVILTTADPKPEGVGSVRVLTKPLDVDTLFKEIFVALTPLRTRQLEAAPSGTEPVSPASRCELVLYVSEGSEACVRALHNLKKVLVEFAESDYSLTVWDLSKAPAEVRDGEPITLTPTLVRRAPSSATRLLGELHDPQELRAFLLQD